MNSEKVTESCCLAANKPEVELAIDSKSGAITAEPSSQLRLAR